MLADARNLPKLSSLQARRRPDGENTEYWTQKRLRVESLKESFLLCASSENLARSITQPASGNDSLDKTYKEKESILSRILSDWEKAQLDIQEGAVKMVHLLDKIAGYQTDVAVASQTIACAKATTDTLISENQISELKNELENAKNEINKLSKVLNEKEQRVQSDKQEIAKWQARERQAMERVQQLQLSEGPEKERLSLLASFLQVKSDVHGKLCGFQVDDFEHERVIKVRVPALDFIDNIVTFEFDNENKLVSISLPSKCKLPSSVESKLREQALTANDAAAFIRGLKLFYYNNALLKQEVQQLESRAIESSPRYSIAFNQSTRVATILLEKKSIYAKLKVPHDYPNGKIELQRLEKPDSNRSLRRLEDDIKSSLVVSGKGYLLQDWLDALVRFL